MFGFDPPLFQKSGMPLEWLSVSKVGLGQRLPGSKPAREAGSRQSRRALDNSWKRNRFLAAALQRETNETGRELESKH
jgi:hypothetical protein